MHAVRKIARFELRTLFFSPIAWLLLIFFFVQSSLALIGRVNSALEDKLSGLEGNEALTASLFSGPQAMFAQVSSDLYLLIPLLTMGLISREYHSGSIKLLLSSPIRAADIVLGKYLATIIYAAILMLVPFFLMLLSGLVIQAPDYPAIITGIFGLLLLVCTYGAIGLFMSALTSNQVVAAISTLTVLATLSFIGGVGQGVPVINEITNWLSLPNHNKNFRLGLFASEQLFYYLAIIGMFLSFTILKISTGRKIESQTKTVVKYIAVVLLTLFVGYISTRPELTTYYDTTRTKSNSLAQESVDLINQIEGDWKIATYGNILHGTRRIVLPKYRYYRFSMLEKYERHNPKLEKEEFLYYGPAIDERIKRAHPDKSDSELATMFAKHNKIDLDEVLSAEETSELIDIGSEKYSFVYELSWEGKREILRFFSDPQHLPGEAEINAALKRLLVGPKTVAYLTENGERGLHKKGDGEYQKILIDGTYRPAIINQGFDLLETNLAASRSIEADILFIADPQHGYSEGEIGEINDFISNGGNSIIAGDIGSSTELNNILASLGVTFMTDQVFETHEDFEPSTVFGRLAKDALAEFKPAHSSSHLPVFLDEAVGIELSAKSSFTVTPILITNPKTTRVGAEAEKQSRFDNTSVPLAVALTRHVNGHEQRIFVIGDADFMSNSALERKFNYETYNEEFISSLFSWVSDGQYPVQVKRAEFLDKRLLIGGTGILWLKIILYGFIPGFLFILGATTLFRRRQN